MKRLVTTVAAAGVAMAMAISGVAAQGAGGGGGGGSGGGAVTGGTGAAPQQDKPSTAGMSDPGGKPTMTTAPRQKAKAHKKSRKSKASKAM